MLTDIGYDVRYALRLLRNKPAFTLVAVLTLALGIGANAAIFSLTDEVLLQSLPVANPQQLVAVTALDPKTGFTNSFSYPMYQDLRDKNEVLSGLLARAGTAMSMSYEGRNDRVSGELVSGNYYEVLGVRPWAGRLFTKDDDLTPGAHPVAVLSYRFWESRFGKDPNLIGKTILLNEQPLTVIGVTPPAFYGVDLTSNADVRVPMMMTTVFNPVPKDRLTRRRHQWMTLIGRRKDGVSLEQAQASMALLYQQIRTSEAEQLSPATTPAEKEEFLAIKLLLQPGAQGFQRLQREMRTPLLFLFGATCVVLLILCANLANLMLARDALRDQEIAVRLALGAGRLRLLRQWLTEAVLLSLLGAVAGVLVAAWVKSALIALMPAALRMNLDQPAGWRFIGFIFVVSIVVGVTLGLAPALRAAHGRSTLSLKGETRTFVSGGGLFSLRSSLILFQVALSLPLLIISVLFLNSLRNLRGVDSGFGKNNVLIASINPTLNGYSTEKTAAFYRDLLGGLRSIPGVEAASLATDSPISGGWDQLGLVVEGYQRAAGERVDAQNSIVSTDYFRSLGIPLLTGRDFTEQDIAGAPKVAIINEKMAKKYFAGTDPIGKKIGTEGQADTIVIGVVRDAQYLSLREPALRHFYQPIAQQSRLYDLTMHLKTNGPPAAFVDQVRSTVQKLDPHLPVYAVKSLAGQVDESLVQERLVTWLCTAFGVLASLLTALGLYGVLAFSVAQRTREIGIRVALGAQARDVFKLIIGQGMLLVSAGVVLGLAASFALTRFIASLLFGITPTNAATFVTVSLGLSLLALLACYLPARRATRVDPLVALRDE